MKNLQDMNDQTVEYASFSTRAAAASIDQLIFMVLALPFLISTYNNLIDDATSSYQDLTLQSQIPSASTYQGSIDYADLAAKTKAAQAAQKPPAKILGWFNSWTELFFSVILPCFVSVIMWMKLRATAGKLLFKIEVVSDPDHDNLKGLPSTIRWFGYYLSMAPLFLGFFWVFFDKKNRTFHDILSRSVVIKKK